MQEGYGFFNSMTLQGNFYVVTQHDCAVLLHKDSFEPRYTFTPLFVPCRRKYSTWAVEGTVLTGKFRRAPDPSCSYFTVDNIHINNGCAKRRSICIALTLLIRDLCATLGAVVLTGNFNKAAERELPTGGSDSQRRISPLEAALNHAHFLWPTSGVTPLWGPGGQPHGGAWTGCCGFVVLPEPQSQWLVVRHGSINVVPASIGVRTKWLLFCSFCVNRTWREYSRHWTRTHKTVMVLSLLDRYWQHVSKMVITRIASMNFLFSSHLTCMESHSVQTNWVSEPNGHKKKKGSANRFTPVAWKGILTVSPLSQQQDKWQKLRKDVLRHKETLFSSPWMPPCEDRWRSSYCHEKFDCHAVALRTWSERSQSADCQ